MRFTMRRNEDRLARLRIARAWFRLRELYFEDAKIAQFDAQFRICGHEQFPNRYEHVFHLLVRIEDIDAQIFFDQTSRNCAARQTL